MLDRVRVKDCNSVGPTVGRLILASGREVRDIARAAGVTEWSVSKWIHGQRGMQSYNLVTVLDALGYDLVLERRRDPGEVV